MHLAQITKENFSFVLQIYAEGLSTGMATFEKDLPSWQKWNAGHLEYGRIAAFEEGKMLGWAALSPVSSRCVYGGVAEVSVYVGMDSQRRGVGKYLLENLIKISEEEGIWTLQSGIMPQNVGSILLHQKCGFRKIGYREKVAKLDGIWTDNVLLERRSKVVGI
jgi:phosphinothricin acetyltransferase